MESRRRLVVDFPNHTLAYKPSIQEYNTTRQSRELCFTCLKALDTHQRLASSLQRKLRAGPLVRGKAKTTVKNAVCEESSVSAYGVFDCQFDFDSHERSCSHTPIFTERQVLAGSMKAQQQAIRRKYASSKFMKVAEMPRLVAYTRACSAAVSQACA